MGAAEHVIRVNLAESPYDIHVKPGLLEGLGNRLLELVPSKRVAVMTDSHVETHLGKTFRESCAKAGIEIIATFIVPAGEENKTFGQIDRALEVFLSAKIERTTPIVALGGGVIGDMAGFVAAIILRGVPFVQVPTTLLAMVDASVGGKTGVNHSVGKNLVGAFHQPIAVFADPQALLTLPKIELVGGLAECIKHDLIRDADGFVQMEKNLDAILALDQKALADLVAHNVAIKAKVVEADPFEKGERAHLNFGHTFGHAIEKVSNFSYSHGQSVALGMTAAAYVSHNLGMLEESAKQRIIALINRAGLPTQGLNLPTERVLQAMYFDKKVKSGKIRFVLLDGIGRASMHDDVPEAIVRDAIESLRG